MSTTPTDTCTPAERRMLDEIRGADAVLIYHDKGPTTISWIKGLSERPPVRFTASYGYLDGQRMVRHLSIRMGLTQKAWDKAVERGREQEADAA